MKELFFALIPGSVFLYRYAPKFEISKIIGLISMEILPYILVCFFESKNYIAVFLSFILLYSFYEIGYLVNDLISVENESVGSTKRIQFNNFNLKKFLIVRLPVVTAVFYWVYCYLAGSLLLLLLSIVSLIFVFILHNLTKSLEVRICTFLVLNSLKIIFRFQILSQSIGFYFISSVPHLIIKLIHYLNSKNILIIDEARLKGIRIPVYIGFIFSMCFYDYRVALVCLPYFLNHCKSNIFDILMRMSNK